MLSPIEKGIDLIRALLRFIPAKWKIREEVKAKGEGQLALGADSLSYWEQRLGWSPEASRYLATAFTFGVRENVAEVLGRAQQLSETHDFEAGFVNRVNEDPSVSGATLEASKFTTSEELRDLLGRILASDVAKPNSVSRRAVSVAQDLTPRDLQQFLKLRAATWRDTHPESERCVLVLGKRRGLYSEDFISIGSGEIGIDYHTFGEFQQLGLLQERAYGLVFEIGDKIGEFQLKNGLRTVTLRPAGVDSALQLGMYALTKAGNEILSLFMNEAFPSIEGYFEEVCSFWRHHGFDVTEEDW